MTWCALAALVFSAGMGVRAYMAAAPFIAGAVRVEGTLLPGDAASQPVRVAFTDTLGRTVTFTPGTIPDTVRTGPVPVAYTERDGRLDARLDVPSLLWADWHRWLGNSLLFALAAVFGRKALTDPGSIIAFKSWRPARPE